MAQTKDKMSEIDDHILKRFDIHKRLGKGAYGIVWKAIDKKTKDVVAVKKIFDAFRNQTDAQRTFREIMFLRSFKNHPNIVQLHSIHRAANNKDIYLGFEYMETDLHNVIKRGNILKDVHKIYIMYQLLKATKYIHSGNVIHRDLKPSNVLLDSLCRCKIADFGLARSLSQCSEGSPSDTDPTLTDYVATRWYRAPEILIANRKYTKGIDMWSLGCIMGEMLLGKPIFPGSSTVNQIERIMATIYPPSQEDINMVCVTGVGSSMIKHSITVNRLPLKNLLGSNSNEVALDLINRLLIFNPYKRSTAEKSLQHSYVARFHNPENEIEMNNNVVPPFSDDVRLAVDEYRNKLYEIMATHQTHVRPIKTIPTRPTVKLQPDVIKADMKPKLIKESDRYLKSHYLQKQKPYNTMSEPKMRHTDSKLKTEAVNIKSDTKLSKKSTMEHHKVYKPMLQHQKVVSHCDIAQKERVVKKRSFQSRSSVYEASFNSYNQSHGVITQSALMELRGTR